MKFIRLIFQNLARNKTRSLLTSAGTMILVFVVTLVWSILSFLALVMTEKPANIKAIVTEKWRAPSMMPYAYASSLREGAATEPEHVKPTDSMSWTFFVGFLDPNPKKRSFENFAFAFCMEPDSVLTMMDGFDELSKDSQEYKSLEADVAKLKQNRMGILLGRERLDKLKKKVGDRFTIYSLAYKEINLEVEVVGTLPTRRYDQSGVMNIEYFQGAMEKYKRDHNGKAHDMDGKTLNLVWLRVPDTKAFTQVAAQIQESPQYAMPAVKVQTASSATASFMEAYADLLWGMRWLLAPAILATLSVVIANAISISVRERQTEFAVLKVLGFQPSQIMVLVLGEALLVGIVSGVVSAGGTWFLVNQVVGGVPFVIAWFPKFMISAEAWWWGLVVGGGTALLGSFVPAWTACRVKVSEVFARVG